jgi:hypothetical protein
MTRRVDAASQAADNHHAERCYFTGKLFRKPKPLPGRRSTTHHGNTGFVF